MNPYRLFHRLYRTAAVAALAASPLMLSAQWAPAEWPVLKGYDEQHLYNISLPLGGIGTGTVGLGGRGELRDWMVMNRPAVGYAGILTGNDAPFFAIHIQGEGTAASTRGLLGPLHPAEYSSDEGRSVNHAGLPRFAHASFETAYPFGQVILSDERLPVLVRIKGFNPLIPGDADRSGIPVAVLVYEVVNLSDKPLDVSICGNMRNIVGQDGSRMMPDWKGTPVPFGARKNVNEYREAPGLKGIYMYSDSVPGTDPAWGSLALSTNAREGVSYRTSSSKNEWSNAMLNFWDDFSADGQLTTNSALADDDPMASLCVRRTVAPGERSAYCFFLTWHFPNRLGWTHRYPFAPEPQSEPLISGNYYTEQYADAWEVISNTLPELPELERKTMAFVSAVVESKIPAEVKEAALFNLSVLRSQTVFRLPDGHLMGWEGIFNSNGSCMGSCTHVWNYEQATAFLFGDLACSMRDVEFNYALNDRGAMSFRTRLPLSEAAEGELATAADGQMGCIMKFYRDWQLSGDDAFLRANWPRVKSALAYAWSGWDQNEDGVMEGRQHNTMDVDYYGPNPQMGLWYLGALKAGAEMAAYLKDKEFEKKCRDLFARGQVWIDENLFNGEYYEQRITDPKNPAVFLDMDDPKAEIPRFQLGRGCLVDQLVGQYMAHICGLGYLVDPAKVRTTLQSIMKYNYLSDFSAHFNNMRSYVMGAEAGLLMASWPKGRLETPFPYFPEAMTGFEYTAAVGMLYEGMQSDGLKCFRAVRERFDGMKRNPFDEPECGHYYARSMASWAGMLALSGFHYSGVEKSMAITAEPGTYFWSNGYAWGSCKVEFEKVTLNVLHGSLELASFRCGDKKPVPLKGFKLAEGESRTISL